ncbi:two-component sensor histidine kinase [Actinomyces sp. zg-332]|nr:two-component sensor histidine kinase [Actinomyces sp. zg-332]
MLEPIALSILLYTIGTKCSLKTTFFCTTIVSTIVVSLEVLINNSLLNNISPLVINITIFIIATLVGSTVQFHSSRIIQLEHLNKQLELERKQHEQLIISAERTRIAREMHDIVAHSLAIVITMADGAEAMIEKNPQLAKQAINQIAQTGRSALAETRRVVGILRENTQINKEEIEELTNELNTQTSTSGLNQIIPKKTKLQTSKGMISPKLENPRNVAKDSTPAKYEENQQEEKAPLTPQPTSLTIESLIEEFKNAGLPIEYTYIGTSIENDSALGLTVYRILQEALTNILRYAPFSPSVIVTINRFHGGVSIVVKNLAGASVSLMKGSGKGIIGMRERAAVYDGYVQAGPTDNGWQVKAFLRLNDKTGESGSWMAPS